MTDVFNKKQRSDVMRSVKSKGNKSTELTLISFFKQNGIKGWRRNYELIGKPDFVFPKLRIAIFTDGCFWHGHDCRNTRPIQNSEYWGKKRERNIKRDLLINEKLGEKDWTVIRIWECEIKNGVFPRAMLNKLKLHK